MNYQNLIIENHTNWIHLVLNRPKVYNALNEEILLELKHFFYHDYHNYPKIKAIVLSGAGDKAFAAGADLTALSIMKEIEIIQHSQNVKQIFNAIENFHLPVIAVIHGYCLGGGLELALACHWRIAAKDATIGFPEIKLGLLPGYSGINRMMSLIGKAKTLEMCLTGNHYNIMNINHPALFSTITENAVLAKQVAFDQAKTIGESAPLALEQILKLTKHTGTKEEKEEMESEMFGFLSQTSDGKEGITAFLQKRRPTFCGQ